MRAADPSRRRCTLRTPWSASPPRSSRSPSRPPGSTATRARPTTTRTLRAVPGRRPTRRARRRARRASQRCSPRPHSPRCASPPSRLRAYASAVTSVALYSPTDLLTSLPHDPPHSQPSQARDRSPEPKSTKGSLMVVPTHGRGTSPSRGASPSSRTRFMSLGAATSASLTQKSPQRGA